jgi:hypothetical protein
MMSAQPWLFSSRYRISVEAIASRPGVVADQDVPKVFAGG